MAPAHGISGFQLRKVVDARPATAGCAARCARTMERKFGSGARPSRAARVLSTTAGQLLTIFQWWHRARSAPAPVPLRRLRSRAHRASHPRSPSTPAGSAPHGRPASGARLRPPQSILLWRARRSQRHLRLRRYRANGSLAVEGLANNAGEKPGGCAIGASGGTTTVISRAHRPSTKPLRVISAINCSQINFCMP